MPRARRRRNAEAPFTVEYYYKTRWGCADEFWRLFRKNHYPVLMRQVRKGRMLDVRADAPRLHTAEEGRWDFRVTITFRSARDAFGGFDEAALKRSLFPDQAAFRKEEQRRFEILLAHWDLPVVSVDPSVPLER